MGPLSLILGLPLAPVRGLLAVAELLRQQAQRELADPAKLRRELEQVDEAVASGDLSDGEGQRAQQRILDRATAQPTSVTDADAPAQGMR